MQYKYTENPAHSKWFTHIKSKQIIFIFEEKVGRNISSGQPTLVSVVIWSKIKNNNKAKNLFEVKGTRLTTLAGLKLS